MRTGQSTRWASRSQPSRSALEIGGSASQAAPGLVRVRPAARRRERHDAAGAPTRSQPLRQVSAERIAGHVRGVEARLVHCALDVVQHPIDAALRIEARPARVPRQVRCHDVAPALDRRAHELPRAGRVHEPVQEDERCGQPAGPMRFMRGRCCGGAASRAIARAAPQGRSRGPRGRAARRAGLRPGRRPPSRAEAARSPAARSRSTGARRR